jgi:F0F1-type ATP synthase membrane subunit b/b'
MQFDASFLVFAAFVLLLVVAGGLGVYRRIGRSLDKRAEEIAVEVEVAEHMRDETKSRN